MKTVPRRERNFEDTISKMREGADELEALNTASVGGYEVTLEVTDEGDSDVVRIKQGYAAGRACDVLRLDRDECEMVIGRLQEFVATMRACEKQKP